MSKYYINDIYIIVVCYSTISYILDMLHLRYPTYSKYDVITRGLLVEFPSLIESERYNENATTIAMVIFLIYIY